jgi:hypothetical protein
VVVVAEAEVALDQVVGAAVQEDQEDRLPLYRFMSQLFLARLTQ